MPQIIAEDFKDNNFFNYRMDSSGCPIIRALIRAGHTCNLNNIYVYKVPEGVKLKVLRMFRGEVPIKDFPFNLN